MLEMPHNVLIFMLGVLAFLSVSTGIVYFLRFRNSSKDYTELLQRTHSWWWMISIIFIVVMLPKYIAIVYFAFLCFLVLKEMFSILPIRSAHRKVIFLLYLCIPLQFYWVAIKWYEMFLIFIPIYICLLTPVMLCFAGDTHDFIKSVSLMIWTVLLTVYSLSHLAYLAVLPETNSAAGWGGLVLFLLCITQFGDVTQYIWGKLLGSHKVIPKISPKKTWEGLIGGVLSTALLAYFLAPYLTPIDHISGLYFGLMIGIAGFLGDIVISAIKRDLQIKDCGTLIPGHGGILDRVDSLLYSSPIFFHVLYFYYF